MHSTHSILSTGRNLHTSRSYGREIKIATLCSENVLLPVRKGQFTETAHKQQLTKCGPLQGNFKPVPVHDHPLSYFTRGD